MTRSKGRTGRPWRRAREHVKRTQRICWLCGAAIDLDLPASDPMSFTVDHVQPLSLGGAEVDVRNLRAAHRDCNTKRGNGLGKRLPASRSW